MSAAIHWLRRDLRFNDNPALSAARSAAGPEPVFSVYSLSDLDRLNRRQNAFVVSCLHELRAAAMRRDATVSLLRGDPAAALVSAARRLNASAVYCCRAYNASERQQASEVGRSLAAAGVELHAVDGNVIHQPEAVADRKRAAGEGYRVFPPFYEAWKSLPVPAASAQSWPTGRDAEMGPLPEAPDEAHAAALQGAGEAEARKALHSFAAGRVADYAVNAEYPARDGTSHLAEALRFGCVSARETYHAIVGRMVRSWTLAQERLSMELFVRRLALREFFIHLAFFANDLHEVELQQKMRTAPSCDDEERLEAWSSGRTGYPLVDAAMRQLRREGRVHRRAAIAAASFCCFDLGLGWRAGRDIWMGELTAADEALCDANWQMIAGVGTDQAAYPRIYNPQKQLRHFDAQAAYVRRYCSELSRLPTYAALAPWRLERQQQIELGFFTPGHYPRPIVEHETAARAALAAYKTHRNR
ncbi:MAG: deoxyribodipyrimidine photo-lyase [Candidatus Eremiobacteraeota bacterium]|nr:deoxyribodipyrimidine photo-lyase [Candidatus Eremiobacteraeota bacterium]MBC5827655.1 deoxyribodipyrimidine photo-lyase [Candidatus Eremiobacteraeota bacterium]